ncbi:MAG: four helix bundle protein [Verrucomicrobia bacterium]|nr:four helix bundle protein [Verrucomicrobiota bacterium]
MNEQGFRSLIVWQRAKALAVEIYRLTRSESIKHDFSLIDQLRRSAVSVPSNIAEGDERKSDKDSIRFFHIAKGSLAELATQLEIARDVGYFTAAQVEPLLGQCAELGKMLGALVRARNNSTPRAASLAPSAPRPTPE